MKQCAKCLGQRWSSS